MVWQQTIKAGAIRIRASDAEPIDAAPFALDAYGAVAVVWHRDRFVLAARGVAFEIASSGGTPVARPLPSDLEAGDADVTGAVSVDGWLVVVRVRRDLRRTYVFRGRSAGELALAWSIDGELLQIAATSHHVGAVGSNDTAVVFPPDGSPIHVLRIHLWAHIIGAVTDAFLLPCASSPSGEARGCLVRIDAAGIDVADRDVELGGADRLIGHAGGFYHLGVEECYDPVGRVYPCGLSLRGERLDLGGLPLPEAFSTGGVNLFGIRDDYVTRTPTPALVALGPDRFLFAYRNSRGAVVRRTLQYSPSEDLR